MSNLTSIFEACKPRADVEQGTTKDEQFAADLAQVVNRTAPPEYSDAKVFFRHSFPTRGMKELLKAVCKRILGWLARWLRSSARTRSTAVARRTV